MRSLLTQADTTYEELERVAVLHGDPPSHAEDRAVIWGRWSFHPDGYFIRYFPSSYTQTQIELYVPESIQVERDTQGRITSISDELGNRIETDYDSTGEVLTDPGHPEVRGFAFRSIRLIQRKMLHPEKVLENRTEWINSGWTLVGDPSDSPATTVPSNPAFNYRERLAASKKHGDELTGLLAGLEITGDLSEAPQQSQSQRDELMNLAHYAQAISEAAQKNDTEWRGRTIDSLELVKKAWMDAVSRTLCTHSGSLTFDPASDPVPGNAASQRLGDSGRPAENNECDNLENAIKNAIAWLERHAAESCSKAQDVTEAEKNVDEGADFEVTAGVRMDTCELVVNGKSGVSFQEFKDYLMKNGKSSAVADAIVLHEREHMQQCYNQDGQEGRPDFANPTPENFCQNEVEAYCTELKSLLNAMNEAGCQPNPELAAKIAQALSKCK